MIKRRFIMILFVFCVAVHLVACSRGRTGTKSKVTTVEILDSSEVTE